MAYLKGGTATLSSRSDDLTDTVVPHIQPGKLYPAVRGLLGNESADFIDESQSGRALSLEPKPYSSDSTINGIGIYHNIESTQPSGVGFNSAITTDGGSTRLFCSNSADFAFGTGDFTIELWARRHDGDTCGIIQMYSDASNRWQLSHYSQLAWYSNVGGSSIDNNATHGADTNWHHYAVVGDDSANTLTVYRDGTQSSQTTSFTQNMSISAGKIYFGTRTDNGSDFTTYSANLDINMIRIVKGTAVYTGNFAAPTALTATGGTYSSTTNVVTSITAGHTKVLINSDVGNIGAYGTEQADGRKYYYTKIRGSKPIKDPRIGAHYGSQRHRFTSIQLLEEETAAHGTDIYSIDGRENIRTGKYNAGSDYARNTQDGARLTMNRDYCFIEATGYFNAFNVIHSSSENDHRIDVWVNGVEAHDNLDLGSSIANPKGGRFVDKGDLREIKITAAASDLTADTPLGITTVELKNPTSSATNDFGGCEWSAQDTGSTARKSQINIPAQNVVSYGQKFSIGSDTLTDAVHQHYDPFNGFTNGTSLHSAYVDTATSIGLDSAPGLSAGWQITGSNHIRPFQGGRVIKWVDSSGAIKTSVNMMPANAQNVLGQASNEITTPSSTNSHTINFSDDAIDSALSETAKVFRCFEFGNGSANGNATYKDVTHGSNMDVTAGADFSWVMDDGLTSMFGNNYKVIGNQPTVSGQPSGNYMYIVFIGTGVSFDSYAYYSGTQEVAINLPYGTHIFKINGSGANTVVMIDNITLSNVNSGGYGTWTDINFHQPRRPPIPDDACIIADYMLMADHVMQSGAGINLISKGVRKSDSSRDLYFSTTGGITSSWAGDTSAVGGSRFYGTGTMTALDYQLPAFCTNMVWQGTDIAARYQVYKMDGATVTPTAKTGSAAGAFYNMSGNPQVIGPHMHQLYGPAANAGSPYTHCTDIVSPIHTSHHYQAFETPYTNELVGGDRNMEQTNLVVTPDGRTWDEVTRDTSYIGNCVMQLAGDHNMSTGGKISAEIGEDTRGRLAVSNKFHGIQKNWCSDYNHWTCLKDGEYIVHFWHRNSGSAIAGSLVVNSVASTMNYKFYYNSINTVTKSASHVFPVINLQRGDRLMMYHETGTIMGTEVEHGPFITILKQP